MSASNGRSSRSPSVNGGETRDLSHTLSHNVGNGNLGHGRVPVQSQSPNRIIRSSLGLSVVGPTKTLIRKTAADAQTLLKVNEAAVEYYLGNPEEYTKENFEESDKHLSNIQETLHKLTSIEGLIDRTLEIPEMKASPKWDQYRQEFDAYYKAFQINECIAQLGSAMVTLEDVLSPHGFKKTRFIPKNLVLPVFEPASEQGEEKEGQEPTSAPPQNPLPPQEGEMVTVDPQISPPSIQVSNRSMQWDMGDLDSNIATKISEFNRQLVQENKRLSERLAAKEKAHEKALAEQAAEMSANVVHANSLGQELMRVRMECAKQSAIEEEAYMSSHVSVKSEALPGATPQSISTSASANRKRSPLGVGFQTASAPQPTSATLDQKVDPNSITLSRILTTMEFLSDAQAKAEADARAREDHILENVNRQSEHLVREVTSWVESKLANSTPKSQNPLKDQSAKDNESNKSESEYGKYENYGGELETSSDEEGGSSCHSTVPLKTQKSRKIQIPSATYGKLKLDTVLKLLPKYDGSDDWEEFRDKFVHDIMCRDELSPNQKYSILKDHLVGKAKSCFVTSKDYMRAIQMTFQSLETVYGPANTKNKLLQKFNKLKVDHVNPDQMRLDMAKISGVRMQLQEKGIPADDDRITKGLASKLPHQLRKGAIKMLHANGDKTTVDDIISRARRDIGLYELEQEIDEIVVQPPANELNSFATINLMQTHKNSSAGKQSSNSKRAPATYDPSKVKATYVDPHTKKQLPGYYARGEGVILKVIDRTFPFDNEEKGLRCQSCDGPHSALRCPDDAETFRSKCEKKRLCPICLSKRHSIKDCKSTYKCVYCSGMHHSGGCPEKAHYRDVKNYPDNAPERQTLFRENKFRNRSK